MYNTTNIAITGIGKKIFSVPTLASVLMFSFLFLHSALADIPSDDTPTVVPPAISEGIPIALPIEPTVVLATPISHPIMPVSSPSLVNWLWGILGILVGVGVVYLVIDRIRSKRCGQRETRTMYGHHPVQVSSRARQAAGNTPTLMLPFGIFPNEFMVKVDPDKLEDFLKFSKTAATDAFFDALGNAPFPTELDIQMAQTAMAKKLSIRILETTTFEMLNGDQALAGKEINYLQQCEAILPAIKVPEPAIAPGDVNAKVLTGVVCAGTIIGFILGGIVDNWGMGLSPDAGLVLGGALGAPISLATALWLASNPQMRKWVLGTTGGVAVLDLVSSLIVEKIPLPKWWLKGKTSLPWKRLVFYAAAFVIVLLIKREKVFDREQYREQVELFAEQWLRSALPIFAVLMFRDTKSITDRIDDPFSPKKKYDELLVEIDQIVRPLYLKESGCEPLHVNRLAGVLKRHGITLPPPCSSHSGPSDSWTIGGIIVWNDSLEESFETNGIIDPGTKVEITKLPTVRDNEVVVKGYVVDA